MNNYVIIWSYILPMVYRKGGGGNWYKTRPLCARRVDVLV